MDDFPRSLPEIVRMAVYDEFVHKLVAKTSELRLGMVKQAGEGGNRCMIDTPKSGKGRIVVAPPHIRFAIKHHLDTFVDFDTESLLFQPVRGGCHLSAKVIRDALASALKSVGLHHVRIHDLRHFCGTQTARVGNLVETMGRLGHSSVGASLRYQHLVNGRDVEIAEALSVLAELPKP